MKLKCRHVDVSEGGEEIYQASFEVNRNQEDSPYVLLNRAFLEEKDGDPSTIYLETHDPRVIGYYQTLDTDFTRKQFVVRLPPPVSEIIEVDFNRSLRANPRRSRQAIEIPALSVAAAVRPLR